MALLLETTLGDLVIDLDIEGSPALCQNVLQLTQARYYTQTLIYNIQANRFCQLGDPHGDGTGGACFQGLLDAAGGDVTKSTKRFLKSQGRRLTASECQERGRVVATEMKGIPDTIGSQFLITLAEGPGLALDGFSVVEDNDKSKEHDAFLSLGRVTEDENNVLGQLSNLYCDAEGRPYADVRVKRVLVIHNPFEDDDDAPKEFLKQHRGMEWDDEDKVTKSPDYENPPEERVETRIPVDQVDLVDDENAAEFAKLQERQQEEAEQHEAKSRAVVLEMLGDLPSAEIKAPEDVLFVCKLNPITEDEDLELIFSRFDQNVKAEIIRDHDTGASLQYAFVEFTKKEYAVEAYFKMNNALVDDRRIKVDFSQSVAKLWDKFHQKLRPSALQSSDFNHGGGRGRGGGGRGRGSGRGGRGGFHNNHERLEESRRVDDNNRGHSDHYPRRRDSNSTRGGRENHYRHSNRDHSGSGGRGRDRHQHGERRNSSGGHDNHHHHRRGSNRSSDQDRRPSTDEFGRSRMSSSSNHSKDHDRPRRSRSGSPDDKNRRNHHRRSRSRSMSRSPSPRRRDQSRSRSRDRDRDHRRRKQHHKSSSRKHHSTSSKKKKRKRNHDDRQNHHRRHDSDSEASSGGDRGKRRHDSENEEEERRTSKRRYDSDASEDRRHHHKKHPKHHHKHHKRRKRSRSRSRSRS